MTRNPSTSIDHRPGRSAIRRRIALMATGATVCALAGTIASGLGSPPSTDAATANGLSGLPSDFPSGTPALPEFPSIPSVLLSSVTPGRAESGSASAQFDGKGGVVVPGASGGLPAAGLPSGGGLPGVGGTGLPPLPTSLGSVPLPATGLPVPPVLSGVPSVPGLPAGLQPNLPSAVPAGLPPGLPSLPGLASIPGVPSLPVGSLGGSGGKANCVSTPPVPAGPLGSLPVTGTGTGSVTSPIGGITVSVSTSGATVCTG